MTKLEKIIADVKKKLGVEVELSPESTALLQSVMDGKVSPEEARSIAKRRLKECKKDNR